LLFVALVPVALATPALGDPAAPSPDQVVSIAVGPAGVWLGSTTGARCFVPRDAGALIRSELDIELARLIKDAHPTRIDVSAAPGASYAALTLALGRAFATGVGAVGVVTEAPRLAPPARVPTTCLDPVAAVALPDAAMPMRSRATTRAAAITWRAAVQAPADALATLAIDTTSLTVSSDGHATPAGTVAALAASERTYAPLLAALRAAPDARILIITAAPATDATLIARVVEIARRAGFDHIVFATA